MLWNPLVKSFVRRFFMGKRYSQILRLLDNQEFMSVSQLSQILEVSPMTIRRDLDEMESKKLIRRLHGGAAAIKTQNNEPFYRDRAVVQVDEKRLIAQIANDHVHDNSIIAVDSGSTCFELVKLLQNRPITVVTNSFPVMEGLLYSNTVKVIVPCGNLRSHEGAISGSDTIEYLSKLHVDQFFMGVGGIDSNAGITDYNIEDAAVKRIIISNASKVIVLADSSKYNRVTFANICPVSELDILVSDSKPAGKLYENLQRSGVQIITPSEAKEDR